MGSKTCKLCHATVYDEYVKTDMGRSLTVAGANSGPPLSSPVTIHNRALDRYFQVFRKGSELYQSEYELDSDGKEVFRTTYKIVFVIGAGENGFSYAVRRGSYLAQAPLSYYSKAGAWDLSPGYDAGDYGFSRTLDASCIVCHSGGPEVVPRRHGLYRNPPFHELAIGCESCHGPGGLHAEERSEGIGPAGRVDSTIVNPAKLPGWLADNICMRCHEGGDVRVLEPGKTYLDFRPGTPLSQTLAIFAVPFTAQSPRESPLLQHYSLMILSKCYRVSGGRLSCITCHNPHRQPMGSEAAADYREKCLACHTNKDCTLAMNKRLATTPPDNCVGCHMPKQDLTSISHSALTDHRIVAYKGEPYPDRDSDQATQQTPGLDYLDRAFGANATVNPAVLLQAYGALMDSHPAYRARHERLLDQLARTSTRDPAVLAALGRRLAAQKTPGLSPAAIRYLKEAINSGSNAPEDYELLATLLERAGRSSEAIATIREGINLDPYNRRFYDLQVQFWVSARRYDEALRTLREKLDLFPQDSPTRKLLKEIEAATTGPE